MGSTVATPRTPKRVHLDSDPNDKGIAAKVNESNTTAIKEATEFTVPTNTKVSTAKIDLKKNAKVKISCIGGGVIRLGLTNINHCENDNILQGSVFEEEEGFGPEATSRILYKTDFNCFCYGPPGEEIEYEYDREGTNLWLYVIFVYGVPEVTAKLVENDEDDVDDLTLCSMIRGQGGTDNLVPNTAVCRIREPVVNGDVYHCRWKMKLKNESIAETSPKYGYMSLRLVSRNDNQVEENTIWERKSAVQEYPFSSVIAFRVNIQTKQVSHNLFVTSVGNTTADYFEDKVKPGSMYFVIEFSSGQIEVTHGRGLLIAQELGSTLLVTGYKCDDEEASTDDILTEISAKVNFQIRRIQFGDSPVSFVLEFNERLTDTDVSHIQHFLGCPVKRVQETDTVQVLIKEPDDVDEHDVKYDIQAHFSREKAGGGRIVSTKKEKDISGCWLIKFESSDVVRKVRIMKRHTLIVGEDTVHARVFPVYKGFGLTVNGGEKPAYDTSPLEVAVDKNKLRFIRTREIERKSFIDSINKRIKVDVFWAELTTDNEDAEFEADFDGKEETQEDLHEPNSIRFRCRVPETEWKVLADWKYIIKKEVLNYFGKTIHQLVFNVKDDAVETILDHLNSLKEKNEFEFDDDMERKEVTLFGSDYQILKHVADQAGKKIIIPENITERVNVTVEKYLALDAERILDQVKDGCPYTSFKVNRQTKIVSLKGPREEVEEAKRKLLSFAIEITPIVLHIKDEQAQFLRKGGTNLLMEEFRLKGMNSNFIVSEKKNTLNLIIYTGNGINPEKRKKDMLGVIDTFIRMCTVNVENEPLTNFETFEWNSFKQQMINKNDGHLIIIDPKNTPIITIVGTLKSCEQGKAEVEKYTKRNKQETFKLRVPIEIAEYLDEFHSEDYHDKVTCLKDSNSCYTGELCAQGVDADISRLKAAIQRDKKEINQHWFYIEKNWIASVIQDLVDLKTLSHRERFLMELDIGHSLAAQGITGVAIDSRSGTIIQVRQGDIVFESTAVIVHSTNGYKSAFESGLGKRLTDIGGDDIKAELLNKIEKISTRFETGDIIVTGSGRLRCLEIVHAFPPKWTDDSTLAGKNMKTFVEKILQICQDGNLPSVALSAIGCGSANYPIERATSLIVEAVSDFIKKNTKTLVLKEIVLCDISKIAVDHFTKGFGCLKNDWFTFMHGQLIEVEDFRTSSLRKEELEVVVRPPSGHGEGPTPSARPDIHTLRWGREKPVHVRQEENENQHRGQNKSEIIDELTDGLPYNIPVTEQLTMHVEKGDLTLQTVNAIVCPSPEFPNLTGEVANAVMKAGGDTIMRECKSLDSNSEGQIITTGAGRLQCDKIYHARIPHKWSSDGGEEFISDLVSSCLKEAINSGFSTIAFPTIGTGKSMFPADKVANAMIKSVCQFGNSCRNSSLTDVTIVIYSMADDTCRILEEVVPHLFKANTTTGMTLSKKGSKCLPRRKTVKYIPPPKFYKHSHIDDVVVVKIVSKGNGKDIQRKIEDIVEKEIITKELNFQKLSKEHTLSELEERYLEHLTLKYGISIEIDKSTKCVKLTGLKNRVDDCEFEVVKLLEDEFPRRRLKQRNISTVASTVQWYYGDADGKSYPVDAESNFEIHTNFLIGQDFIYHNHKEKKKYKMITNDMVEHPTDDPNKKRRLYLRTNIDKEICLPDTWTISENGGDVAQYKLTAKEAEFNEVKDALIKAGCRPKQIISITRLENKFMWLQYQTKKKQLDKQNTNKQNERRLWHGTNIDTVPKIIKNGYDRSFAGNANMTAHGKGVYFAVHSAYSDRDQYATRDANGNKRMFWNRVLTGEFCKSNQNMATLPQRPGCFINNFQVYFDSAADEMKKPNIFVIFHDTQAYPEYLIEYK